jgi:hypothetical protein
MTKSELRMKSASIGANVAITVFAIVGVAFSFLEISFRTWSVGQYFENRGGMFAGLFIAAALCSVLTLILSCLGRGRSRGIGIAFSVGSLALIAFIFSASK